MIEWLAPGFLYTLIKDGFRLLPRGRRKLDPAQILALRQKWKPLFEQEIWNNHSKKLRQDAIIRDVKRLDSYPNIDEKRKKISPWFRVSLVGLYHKGALFWLNEIYVVEDKKSKCGYRIYENSAIDDKVRRERLHLIGKIPFERVEAVDWEGDEYYYFPHIYCHFESGKKTPYEDIVCCRMTLDSLDRPRYIEIVPYSELTD